MPPPNLRVVPPDEIFFHAVRFEASARLLGRVLQNRPLVGYASLADALFAPGPPTAIPSFVNFLFALELYLKALIALETPAYTGVQGHEPLKLFKKVSQPRQDRIAAIFDIEKEQFGEWAMLKNHPPARPEDYTLEGILKNAAKTFVEYRYVFEGIPDKVVMAGPVVPAVRKTILEIKPEWERWVELDP